MGRKPSVKNASSWVRVVTSRSSPGSPPPLKTNPQVLHESGVAPLNPHWSICGQAGSRDGVQANSAHSLLVTVVRNRIEKRTVIIKGSLAMPDPNHWLICLDPLPS